MCVCVFLACTRAQFNFPSIIAARYLISSVQPPAFCCTVGVGGDGGDDGDADAVSSDGWVDLVVGREGSDAQTAVTRELRRPDDFYGFALDMGCVAVLAAKPNREVGREPSSRCAAGD